MYVPTSYVYRDFEFNIPMLLVYNMMSIVDTLQSGLSKEFLEKKSKLKQKRAINKTFLFCFSSDLDETKKLY